MRNIKLSTKLMLSFLVIILVFVTVISVVGLQLRSINENNEQMKANSELNVMAQEMDILVQKIFVRITEFVRTDDPSNLNDLDEFLPEFNDKQAELYKHISTEREVSLFNELKDLNEEFEYLYSYHLIPAVETKDINSINAIMEDLASCRINLDHVLNDIQNIKMNNYNESYNLVSERIGASHSLLISGLIIAILLSVIIVYFIVKYIKKSINSIIQVTTAISKGDLTVSPLNASGNDEFLLLMQSVNKMLVNTQRLVQQIQTTSDSVSTSSDELSATSHQLATASEEIAKTIHEIAESAGEQAKNTEEGAHSIDRLAEDIQKVLQASLELDEICIETESLKNKGLQVVKDLTVKTDQNNKASETVAQIIFETSDSVDAISKAASLINTIAEQTSLLSLNAAIEAARAGEAGKGFAVVAGEIRKLADQSSDSVKEIDDIIKNLQNKFNTAVDEMQQAKGIVSEQSQAVSTTENIFNELSKAIEQNVSKNKAINSLSKEMEQLKNTIVGTVQSLAAIAEENAASCEQVAASAQEQASSVENITASSGNLSDLTDQLKALTDEFEV
ncbi:HAMP domain-containing methyl-accepting chemotaxis protein [Serpentinicella sp. ANB-PHB4]|uniref:methyl-accepting chemotaxis protein n=1 Tax=Serpentinicella sp. ANB-PHB4 TaxID=3074076 RepID=UPI0028543E38|nr:HAMP domain-containing methyl-accepting chemotaxis protein [Serpentinicella sp. ANB-PHB4]MDR5659244.1 HAMP domain-containing methyl-accepting chemotaxis protein [Serpentinicella sp. ANB-PHB4]